MSGSPGYQPIWVPVENCSQGFCSIYCPQWCYVTFPPPPPFVMDGQDSGSTFSPLVIAIIGILASAFLLISYYTVVAKYCGDRESTRRRSRGSSNENFVENQNTGEAWLIPNDSGLDESVIRSITVCKYKKGDGLIQTTDCSVCLGEFQEDESLRLLPKCSHAFHLSCIDRWLRAHSNCPLCRANVVCIHIPVSLPPPSSVPEISILVPLGSAAEQTNSLGTGVHVQAQAVEDGISSATGAENSGFVGVNDQVQEREEGIIGPNTSRRSQSDLGREEDAIVEISFEEIQALRRSISMDSSSRNSISIVDMLLVNQGSAANGIECSSTAVSCEQKGLSRGEFSGNKNLNKVTAPPPSPMMRRSLSGGKFLLGRGRNAILPL